MFIDIHAHLEFFKELKSVISNSKKEQVNIILSCGVDSETNKMVLAFSQMFSEIKPCMGIYPSDALKMSSNEINEEIDFIKKNKDNIIAIGEVGIDLKEQGKDILEKQKENLKKFVLLAKELNKPVIIHSRQAEEHVIDLLEEINYNKVIMHCFMGNMKLVQKIINNKWYLSIPTCVKNSKHFQEVIKITPLSQLFCETDSPFLHPDKKYPNEPSNVIESYKKISEIKKISMSKVENEIEENFKKLFK